MPVEWYCKKTWSPANREDFFRRLERTRTAYYKAQYLVIQAETLLKTKKREANLVALELLEMALTNRLNFRQNLRSPFFIRPVSSISLTGDFLVMDGVQAVAVPEPSAIVLLMLGASLFVRESAVMNRKNRKHLPGTHNS